MRKTIISAVTALFAGGMLLTGCGSSPCDDLERASQAEIAAANQGAEIERETAGWTGQVDCELHQGRWIEEMD